MNDPWAFVFIEVACNGIFDRRPPFDGDEGVRKRFVIDHDPRLARDVAGLHRVRTGNEEIIATAISTGSHPSMIGSSGRWITMPSLPIWLLSPASDGDGRPRHRHGPVAPDVGPCAGQAIAGRARGLAEGLPFATGAIDRIFVVDAFHHFADQPLVASELVRVWWIEEPDLRHLAVKGIAIAEKLALMQSHFYSPPALAELFVAAGGTLIEVTPDRISAHVLVTK